MLVHTTVSSVAGRNDTASGLGIGSSHFAEGGQRWAGYGTRLAKNRHPAVPTWAASPPAASAASCWSPCLRSRRAWRGRPDGKLQHDPDTEHRVEQTAVRRHFSFAVPRVTVISPQGTVLRRWGSQGVGPGQFQFTGPAGDPHGRVAIGLTGLVYVSDSGNDRVQVFTAGGHFVKQFGNDQLLSPDFLAVDGAGNTYILDDNGTTKFSPAGVLVWRIIPGVSSDPDLNHGILPGSLDSHGRLLAALPERDRVIYLDPDGHKVDAFEIGLILIGGPCRVTVDAQGNIYVTACGPNGDAPDFVGAQGADSLVFDREHKLVGDWRGAPHDALRTSPRFGPNGKVFALEWDGTLVELKIRLHEQ